MSMRSKYAALFAAMMLAVPTAVSAADFIKPLPPVVKAWYLRADIGYKWYGAPEAIFDAPTFGAGFPVPGAGELFAEEMGNAWSVGGGIGYDPVGAARFDFTLDYESPAEFYGRLTCPAACAPATFSEETADISAWAGLFNVYFDLGKHGHWQPYVGAGAGFSALITTNVASTNPPGSSYPGDTHWNFAWALMAGVSKEVSQTMKLDLGYRFINLGEARSGVIDDGAGNTGFFQYQNIHAHEFRFGIRHML
jgi:opacity protein-like surface antigen